MTTPREAVARRRAQRDTLLGLARSYVDELPDDIELRAAVVAGPVARGDFHDPSDVDVVVVADRLPADAAQRWLRVAPGRGVVQPAAWTPREWRKARRRDNPLAVDALDHGVWLAGRLFEALR
ncbi:MAG TPA: hypothetical protein VG452_03075 [Egibacteraceae bacterium]|nr:hypothetical protein [Egibacteraceae bacterium]